MNREAFYLEIGDIDDDLIQEAANACRQAKKKNAVYRIVGIAACFCLICAGLLFIPQGDSIYINEIAAPSISKVVVPADENTKIIPMTYQELLDYYGIKQLPETLGDDLIRTEQSYFVLYQDQDENVLYDSNIFYFSSTDRSKSVSITIAKAEEFSVAFDDKIRRSEIGGVSMMIAAASNNTDHTAYWASFKLNDISVKIISDGMSREEFINMIKELLKYY